MNQSFERRLGLWPAGVDEDGILYCNQYFADYPKEIPEGKFDARSIKPKWMLLSYKKKATALSELVGYEAKNAVDESAKTVWQSLTSNEGEWLEIDLEKEMQVSAIQVNLGDHETPKKKAPRKEYGGTISQERYIEEEEVEATYLLETSLDGKEWTPYAGGKITTNLPHKLFEEERRARFVRITFERAPYGTKFTLSGLRVFGYGEGEKPKAVKGEQAIRNSDTKGSISWEPTKNTTGYCIRLGIAPDKLYNSVLLYEKNSYEITFLNAEVDTYYYAIDSFNEQGITEGEVKSFSK